MSIVRRPSKSFLETFGEVRRALWQTTWRVCSRYDVGPTQVLVMRTIAAREPLTQCALAKAVAMDPSALSRTVAGFVDDGWVERRRGKLDRREYLVSLTTAGRTSMGALEAAYREAEALVTSPLDARDLSDFHRIAGKLVTLDDGQETEPRPPDARSTTTRKVKPLDDPRARASHSSQTRETKTPMAKPKTKRPANAEKVGQVEPAESAPAGRRRREAAAAHGGGASNGKGRSTRPINAKI